MCFGGSKSTNNVNTPAYAPTPEGGAAAVQQDSVASPAKVNGSGLSDRPTQADFTSTPRTSAGVGLTVKGM